MSIRTIIWGCLQFFYSQLLNAQFALFSGMILVIIIAISVVIYVVKFIVNSVQRTHMFLRLMGKIDSMFFTLPSSVLRIFAYIKNILSPFAISAYFAFTIQEIIFTTIITVTIIIMFSIW